jgi:hypothetical protein
MSRVEDIKKPRTDDRKLWDIVFGVYGGPALLIGHKLKMFSLLAERPRTLAEVSDAVKIDRRPAQAILSTATALGFVQVSGDLYSLTQVAEDFLLEDSPTYFGWYWDLIIETYDICTYKALHEAVVTNSPQEAGRCRGAIWDDSPESQKEMARQFTQAMHSIAMSSALVWPDVIDLSNHRVMLDIGGGSGAHSIGAAVRWPNLQPIVSDLAPVCGIAEEFILRYNMKDRIKTQVGDMWKDPFPPADIHFYGNIYHLWTPARNRELTAKSFQSLKPGGRIIIHEILYNAAKTAPFAAAAFSMTMMGWNEGEQYSDRELADMLQGAGFREVQVKASSGYNSIVTAIKT